MISWDVPDKHGNTVPVEAEAISDKIGINSAHEHRDGDRLRDSAGGSQREQITDSLAGGKLGRVIRSARSPSPGGISSRRPPTGWAT